MSKTSKGSETSGQWLKTQVCDCLKSLERDFMRFCRCHNTFLCYLSKLLMSLIIYFNKFYEALHNKYIKTKFKCYTKKISISYNIFHDIVNSMLFTNSVIIFWKLHMQYRQHQIISVSTCHKLRGHNLERELVCKDLVKSDTTGNRHIVPLIM